MNSPRADWRPRTILVGFDGTERDRDAAVLAASLAGSDSELLLVHIVPPAGVGPIRPRQLGSDEVPGAQELFAPGIATLGDLKVETGVYLGRSPARELTAIAEEKEIDLIVIGPPRPKRLERALLGGVIRGLMSGAPAPTAMARMDYGSDTPEPPQTIAVAFDGMPESIVAVEHAEALARPIGASLRLLTVATRATTIAGMLGYVPPMPKSPSEVLADGVASVADDIKVEGRKLEGGSIPAAIAADCEDGVDLIVTGSRGYGAFSRVMIGSVSTGLLNQAACPVMVTPRPNRDEIEAQQVEADTPS